ncbi:MAG: discoidin domain-containing protein [Anaerolineae bacterium]|jgi:hypothetical protein
MPDYYPPYIFGMHDRGGEHLMLSKNRRGWVLVTEALGADPNNQSGTNYTDLSNQGLGVLARLNHGYGTAGTIPHSSRYDDFARRCGNFVQASPGCHIWIIGNEMNLAYERPGGPNGQVITPQLYATCFRKCRDEIRRRPGHGEDQVVPGAVGPWNTQTKYEGNQRGDWIKYFADILDLLGNAVDGIAVHTYTHGQEPHLVFDNSKMNAPFQDYHWHFRAYRDFMSAIPDGLTNRPVYITETDQYGAWRDANTGWVRNAYKEIDDWSRNSQNQPIQALILYRWIIGNPNDPQQVGWAIEPKHGVQDDWRDAMNNEYRVVLPDVQPNYRAEWLEVNAPGRMGRGAVVRFSVRVRNVGRSAWANSGSQRVRMGYRWIDSEGNATAGPRQNLPRTVAPGETVTLPEFTVRAPEEPGYLTLELDLVEETWGWFGEQGSPTWQKENLQVGPRYRAAWLSVDAPTQGTAGTTVTFPVRVLNEGAFTWPSTGERPVNLTYKWLNANGQVVVADGLRTPLPRDVEPLGQVLLDARVQYPAAPGQYVLQMDMVHEFVVWFQWKGSPVYEVPTQVDSGAPGYAAEWLDYSAPERLVAGQFGNAYIEVRNVGSQPWPESGADAVRLGNRWLDADGQEVPVSDPRTWPMPRTIEPGITAIFRDIEYVVPDTPGAYRLVWDLMQAGTWLSSQGVAVKEQTVQVVASEYGVTWEVLEPWPDPMPVGELLRTSLRLRNTGTNTWSARGDQPVHLAYTWFAQTGAVSEPWDTFRILLPHDVPSGGVVELPDVAYKTPPVLGEYILRWDLVEEGQTWFFRHGGAPLEVPVKVADKAFFVPWTAEASHNPGDVMLAFDGNTDTVWNSKASQEPGMWFKVDLGQDLVLDRIRVSSPGRGFPLGYRILLSTDGQAWHLVAERPKNWSNVDEAFAPRRARYVRLEQTGRPSWPASWMISEITVSATNPWAGADASHYSADVGEALDAHLPTAWNTRNVKQRPGMYFNLDMGSLRKIERVMLLHPSSQQPRGYVMEVSADGQDWQEIGRKADNWHAVDVEFAPLSARYVRVKTTNSSAYQPWGIAEFVVWRTSPTWLVGRQA